MNKLLLGGIAVAAILSAAPAVAQPTPAPAPVPAPQVQIHMEHKAMRAQTRDQVVAIREGECERLLDEDVLVRVERCTDVLRVLRRELLSGVALGCILGSIGFLRISIWSVFSNLYGPHWFNIDLSLNKTIPICERLRFTFQAEFLNVMNHPTWGPVTTGASGVSVQSQSFGQTTGGPTGPRVVEFRANIEF